MSQAMPSLGYPGGRSAFFVELHLDFPRWLRLISLVPLVHASINGLSYEGLCFHILNILPSSNPPNIFIVSADCIRSSVAEMLSKEPFFVCSLPDNGSSSLSTSRWVYESSFDSDPSRISFAFSILRCFNLSPGLSVRDALSNLIPASLSPNLSMSLSNDSRSQYEPRSLCDVHEHGCSPPPRSPTAAVRVSVPSCIGPPVFPARAGLDLPNQQTSRFPSALGSLITHDPFRPCEPFHLSHGSVLPVGLTTSGETPHPDHVSSHLSQSSELPLPQRFCSTSEQSGTNTFAEEHADSAINTQHPSTSGFPGHLDESPSSLPVSRCDSLGNSYARIPLFQTPILEPSQNLLSPQGSGSTYQGRRLSQCSPVRRTGLSQTDCPRSDDLHTSPPRRVDLEVCFDFEGEWPAGAATDACPPSNHGAALYQSANLLNDLGREGCATHEAMPTGVLQAQCDIEPSETSTLKETRRSPDHANAPGVPCSTLSVPEGKSLALSSPALRNLNEHEKLVLDQRLTPPMSTPNNGTPISHLDGNCAVLTPTSSDPESRPIGLSSFVRTSRPSVVVYKVATGPNFSGSRNVIRVSYGEGRGKRTPLTNSSNRNMERLGRQGYSTKEYGITETEHPNRKSMRSRLCSSRRYRDDKRSPSGLRRAEIKMSGMPPAERVVGDMAWDFGVGPGRSVRPVDADRSRVRVGGLTSVRMIPRTVVNGGIGPKATSTSSTT